MTTHSPRLDMTATCRRTIKLTDTNMSTNPNCLACRRALAHAIAARAAFRRAQVAAIAVASFILLAQLAGCGGEIQTGMGEGTGGKMAQVDGAKPDAVPAQPDVTDGLLTCPLGVTARIQCSSNADCPLLQPCQLLASSCRDGAGGVWTHACAADPVPPPPPALPACRPYVMASDPCTVSDAQCHDPQTYCQAIDPCLDGKGQPHNHVCTTGTRTPACAWDVYSMACAVDADCSGPRTCQPFLGNACVDQMDVPITRTCQTAP